MMKKQLLLLPLLLISIGLFAQEVAQWRGENRDGIYNETGLLKQWPESGPELLWHFDDLGDGHASAAVISNRVFTAGTDGDLGYIFSLDHDGNLQWKAEYGKEWVESWDGVRSTPLIVDKDIYMMSGYGKIVNMSAIDGQIKWSVDILNDLDGRNIKWGVTENLLIDGDMLFCTAGGIEANVIALNRTNGEVIWKCAGNGEISAYNSPALIDLGSRKIIVTMTQNSILGIDISDGKLLWNHEHKNEWSVHPNTPIYHDGMIYCFSGYGSGGKMLKLSEDGTSVEELWTNTSLDNQMGGAILQDGRIYGGGQKSKALICLDWNTGKELFSTKDVQKATTIFAEDILYCYDDRGFVALVNPNENEFEVISSFKVPYGKKQHWAHLVIYNKKLFVRHGTSLMVYSIAAE